ncbi:MAG: glycosyltransferase family 4 protein [Candidatus Methylomirabilales bacterium]
MELLEKHFDVESVHYDYHQLATLLLLVPRIMLGVHKADLVVCWFASFHAFLALLFCRLFGKESIVVAGGYDAVSVPEIGYGLMDNRFLRIVPVSAFRMCDLILSVSESLKEELLKNVNVPEHKVRVIPLGFGERHRGESPPGRQNRVLTVGGGGRDTWNRKGLDTFLMAASTLPSVAFVVAGAWSEQPADLDQRLPTNVRFLGWLGTEELAELYRTSRVYAQLSAYESFGCALAEAMASGCYPVATDRGALPELIGEAGTLVAYGDPDATSEAIREGLRHDGCEAAARRIRERFPSAKREKLLVSAITELHGNRIN